VTAGDLYGRPTASELVEAVREFLERDVADATEGRVRFHVRVAVNALAMVERELAQGPGRRAAERDRLARIGYDSESDLAVAIRSGDHDPEDPAVRSAIRDSVIAKVSVANPDYLEDVDRPT
jgi:hypothetical protein